MRAREKYDAFDGDWEFVGIPREGTLKGETFKRIFYVAVSGSGEVNVPPTMFVLWRPASSPFDPLKRLASFEERPAKWPAARDVDEILSRAGVH